MKKQIVVEVDISEHFVELSGWEIPSELDSENVREIFNDVIANLEDE